MREIIFRAKRVDNSEWVEGYLVVADNLIATENKLYIIESGAKYYFFGEFDPVTEVISETVGQFTGLLDKHGNKIFEGDILQNTPRYVYSGQYRNIVVFEDGEFLANGYSTFFTADDFKYCEVIGNIHDNKLEDF